MQATSLKEMQNQFKQQRDVNAQERSKTYRDVEVGQRYCMTRCGISHYVWVAEVKRKDIVLKRSPDAKDSFTENRTRFDRFYVHTPE